MSAAAIPPKTSTPPSISTTRTIPLFSRLSQESTGAGAIRMNCSWRLTLTYQRDPARGRLPASHDSIQDGRIVRRRPPMEHDQRPLGPTSDTRNTEVWPPLPLECWEETYTTVHRWTQIVGKIRLALCADVNHWWHTTLYVTPRGLTTGPMPYGERTVQIEFDFVAHQLQVTTADDETR